MNSVAQSVFTVVIIDDNQRSLELLSTALAHEGLVIYTAEHPAKGLDLVRAHRPELVLTDLVMPGMSGLDVLDQVMLMAPETEVMLMTAHYTCLTAVSAIRRGAADYLEKPVPIPVLRERVGRLMEAARLRRSVLSGEVPAECDAFEGIMAKSPRMWSIFSQLRRVAPHYRSALITGETGTGKDLIARALHRLSGVRGRYVVLNCSAVVETLFESELFGHVKGAFTGADREKPGLFEVADGGTIFLDEIGDMPLTAQAKLLRAVQNQEIQRVGSLTPHKVNVRVIAATHHDIRQAIADRTFREDLYYRLSMIELKLPSLADRMEDLPLLIRHFIQRFGRENGVPVRGITQRAQRVLERHTWPGNVRELEHVIGHASMMATSDLIDVPDLPESVLRQPAEPRQPSNGPALPTIAEVTTAPGREQTAGAEIEVTGSFSVAERELIKRALETANGNQSEAARHLGLGRDALRYKLKKHGLL